MVWDLSIKRIPTMRKANYLASGLFSAFAILIITIASKYPPSNHGVPGPGMFPIIVAILILVSAVTLALTTFLQRNTEDSPIGLTSRDNVNVYVTMVGLIIYTVLLPMLGFISTTAVMLLLYIKWFSKRSWLKCIIISVIFTMGIYLLFGLVLNVPMRFGLLF